MKDEDSQTGTELASDCLNHFKYVQLSQEEVGEMRKYARVIGVPEEVFLSESC